MNLNFYDVMKKGFYFSSAGSLIFSRYSNYVNIYYYEGVLFTFDDII